MSLLLLVMITDSTLQHHFSSCLDQGSYFSRTKTVLKNIKMQLASGLIDNMSPSGIVPRMAQGRHSLNGVLRTQRGCSSFRFPSLLIFFWELAQNPFLYCFVTEGKEFTAYFSLTTAGISRKIEICVPICHLPLCDL